MKNKISFGIILFMIGIILAAVISTKAFKEAYRSRKIQKEVETLKMQAERIQSENDALRQRISYLQTPEFQEKVAKEKLNLQKPDENVVVVKPAVSAQQKDDQTQAQTEEVQPESPNHLKWWNYFFKYE